VTERTSVPHPDLAESVARAPAAGGPPGGGVSRRAVAIAFLALVLLAPTALYVELVYYLTYNFTALVPPIVPLAVLFIVAGLSSLLARRWRIGLSRQEILVIYAIVMVGAPLMSHGILLWWISASIGQPYFGRAVPQWEPTFFQYIPRWFYPSDPAAVEGFFQGSAHVPWSLWSLPLAAWISFFIALFLANLFLLLILKRQWISHERLAFPIALVPLETVRERDVAGRRLGVLPTSWMFWIGFLIAVVLSLQARLPSILPSFPAIPVNSETVLIPWQKVGPLAGLGDVYLILYPDIIALAYLIPKELSFSVWFFWVIRVASTVAAIAAGATPQKPEEWYGTTFPAPYYQGGGAVIALTIWSLWVARRHLGHVLRFALTGRPETPYAAEPFTYRTLVLGLLLSFGYLVFFCWLAGVRIIVGIALIGLILTYHIVWARLRAENGMSFIAFPFEVNEMLFQPLGSAAFRPAEIITVHALRWAYFPGWGESCEVVTGGTLDSLKIADSANISQRRLTIALVGGFLLSLFIGAPMVLAACYHWGMLQLHAPTGGWLDGVVRSVGTVNYDLITSPSRFNPIAVIALAAGAAFTFFLGVMRLRFWWWPFHPVGYLAANVWGSQWWYMPMFVGWVLKSLAIRYGGLRLYQQTIPTAIGVIIGTQLVSVLWNVIAWWARASM